jgi:putative zinc finger/helix-turn-helix YgiT family protein
MARSMLDPFECPACLKGMVRCVSIPYDVTIRERVHTVPDAEVMQCETCGEIFFAPGQSDALQRKAADAVRPELGLLTGKEMADFRRSLGLTQAQLERTMGVPEKTVARWEVGCVIQSRAADRFLRVLMAHPELVAELAEAKPPTAEDAEPAASDRHVKAAEVA